MNGWSYAPQGVDQQVDPPEPPPYEPEEEGDGGLYEDEEL